VTRLLLIRHAESIWNAAGRWQGHADPPLSERGRQEAEALARELARAGLERVVTSDLARAIETGAALAGGLGIPALRCPGLRELDVGRWTGLTRAEVAARDPEALAAFDAGGESAPAGGGETRAALARRARASLAALARTWPDSCVGVVTHLGVIRALVGEALDHAAWRWLETREGGLRAPGLEPS
jgi:broad specificity phosphatase PhoE